MVRCPPFSTSERHCADLGGGFVSSFSVASSSTSSRMGRTFCDRRRSRYLAPMSSRPIMPTNAASPPRFATPFATFAALPPGQYDGSIGLPSGRCSLKDSEAWLKDPAPAIHCSPHALRRDLMSSSESTGTHPPGSEMPHASKTRAARLGSSRRTRMSLTGSPSPTRRTGLE